jgi:hypothetical protein
MSENENNRRQQEIRPRSPSSDRAQSLDPNATWRLPRARNHSISNADASWFSANTSSLHRRGGFETSDFWTSHHDENVASGSHRPNRTEYGPLLGVRPRSASVDRDQPTSTLFRDRVHTGAIPKRWAATNFPRSTSLDRDQPTSTSLSRDRDHNEEIPNFEAWYGPLLGVHPRSASFSQHLPASTSTPHDYDFPRPPTFLHSNAYSDRAGNREAPSMRPSVAEAERPSVSGCKVYGYQIIVTNGNVTMPPMPSPVVQPQAARNLPQPEAAGNLAQPEAARNLAQSEAARNLAQPEAARNLAQPPPAPQPAMAQAVQLRDVRNLTFSFNF